MNKYFLIRLGVCNVQGRITPAINRLVYTNPSLVQKIVEATSFIRYDASLKERVHFLLQNIRTQPTCQTCGAVLRMAKSGHRINTIGKYCGARCAAKDPNR